MSAIADVTILSKTVEIFKTNEGRYLSSAEGLPGLTKPKWFIEGKEKQAYIMYLHDDPWGEPYHYRYPGIHNPNGFDLWTYGGDGKPGGEGANADCGNWHLDNCYPRPTNYLEWVSNIVLVVVSPALWLPVFIGYSFYRLARREKFTMAIKGWHFWLMIASFPLFILLAFLLASVFSVC